MMNSALSGLPPLPKSLSGLLNPEDDSLPSFSQGLGHAQASSAFRPVPVGGSHGAGGQGLYANARPRSRERSASSGVSGSPATTSHSRRSPSVGSSVYMNTSEARTSSYSPSGGRKWTNLDSQLSFLRQEMVSLRQMDMDLLCTFWSLNEKMQEYKAQQSRNSSLSPHDWLEQDEGEEGESDEEEFYNNPEEVYIQPYRNGGGQEQGTPYRNGHGSSSRLKPVAERGYGNGSNSSLEYGDI